MFVLVFIAASDLSVASLFPRGSPYGDLGCPRLARRAFITRDLLEQKKVFIKSYLKAV